MDDIKKMIRDGKMHQVRMLLKDELFASVGGSLPDVVMEKIVKKIDQIYGYPFEDENN